MVDHSDLGGPCIVRPRRRKLHFVSAFRQGLLKTGRNVFSLCFSGFVPHQACFPLPGTEPRPPMLRPGPQPWTDIDAMQLTEQRRNSPCHPGIRLSCGPGWRQFAASAGTQLFPKAGDRKVLCHPDIPLACGQEESRGPCNTGIALSCGQGWRSTPCLLGTDQVGVGACDTPQQFPRAAPFDSGPRTTQRPMPAKHKALVCPLCSQQHHGA